MDIQPLFSSRVYELSSRDTISPDNADGFGEWYTNWLPMRHCPKRNWQMKFMFANNVNKAEYMGQLLHTPGLA
jgi:hypothetical protein